MIFKKLLCDFLNAELAKYESWDEFKQVNKSINPIISDASNFEQLKQRGVGQTTILKFVGYHQGL
jgi:hypothetical protein